jgi:hypothetical protein
MTTDRTIDYEALAQDAMRGVVRTILAQVAKGGLPGDHHFYISFDTQAPGVTMSKRLREKYPQEMTIVLQHRFWDLLVNDERFEVKLTFDGIPERLVVPFAAIKVFFDPSVRYGLQFESPDLGESAAEAGDAGPEQAPRTGRGTDPLTPVRTSRTAAERRMRPTRKPRIGREGGETGQDAAKSAEAGAAAPGPAPLPKPPAKPLLVAKQSGEGAPAGQPPGNEARPPEKPAGARVVSLDAFRKK